MSQILGRNAPQDVRPPGTPGENLPFLSIVVPTLNEEAYIEECLVSLLAQWPEARMEILVMDGGSTDATAAQVLALAERHPCIQLRANPRRIQSAAVNIAATTARAESTVLLRADAHAFYPPGWVRACVAALLSTGASSVVVPMRNEARPEAAVQRAIAAAQSSRLGNGGSAHRSGATSGFVDHGHHAVFDRAFFLSTGGYDESFTHNEDAEFDHRALTAGGRAWMCAEAPVIYYPRRSLGALARQYFAHGGGRARTLLKHGTAPRPRQMAPVAVLLGLGGSLAVAPLFPAFAAPALLYPLACLGWGVARATTAKDAALLLAGPALMTMHLAWAGGFLRRVIAGRRSLPVREAPSTC